MARAFKEVRREKLDWPTRSVATLTEITYSDGIYTGWRYEGVLKDGTRFSLEWRMPLNAPPYPRFEAELTGKQQRAIVYAIKKVLDL